MRLPRVRFTVRRMIVAVAVVALLIWGAMMGVRSYVYHGLARTYGTYDRQWREMAVRDRELAILRVGWLSQAPFEWGSHVKISKRIGVTAEEIERVTEGSSAPGWSKRDRAILRAVEELHFDSMVTDETWADLQEFFNDKKLIELLILVGQYKTVAYYQNSLRLPMAEGNLGLLAR